MAYVYKDIYIYIYNYIYLFSYGHHCCQTIGECQNALARQSNRAKTTKQKAVGKENICWFRNGFREQTIQTKIPCRLDWWNILKFKDTPSWKDAGRFISVLRVIGLERGVKTYHRQLEMYPLKHRLMTGLVWKKHLRDALRGPWQWPMPIGVRSPENYEHFSLEVSTEPAMPCTHKTKWIEIRVKLQSESGAGCLKKKLPLQEHSDY